MENNNKINTVPQSLNEIIIGTTKDFLATYVSTFLPPEKIESMLLDEINDAITFYNLSAPDKSRKYQLLKTLPNYVIALIMSELYTIVNLDLGSGDSELAFYNDEGKDEGLYVINNDAVKKIAESYNKSATEKDLNEIISKLIRIVPNRPLTKDADLIAVNNGIFDYKRKILMPFSPDKVFVSKSRVNYNPSAKNITIHNNEDGTDWNVEDWMRSLSDDSEIVELLWQIIGAIIRPNVSWNKSAWLYATTGNNGKGTLCRLMKNICGDDSCDSISITQFMNDAYLDRLMRVSAVIADENDVKVYIDSAAKLKAAITGDPITINRKYLPKLKFVFRGFIVQCVNGLPRVHDNTPSFLRRLLIIPMSKCFSGQERTYIKDDYLQRPEVLEYVLHKVLNMDYYRLNEPQACREALNEYIQQNDPLHEFWSEFRCQFIWEFLPYPFLYDLYKEWFKRNCPSGRTLSNITFCNELKAIVESDPDWEALTSPRQPGSKLSIPEPLIVKYVLTEWMDKNYTGIDNDKKAIPSDLSTSYRGLIRKTASNSASGDND